MEDLKEAIVNFFVNNYNYINSKIDFTEILEFI